MEKTESQTIERKKIIIDTNFLLVPGQFRVDIFDEIERIAHFPYELMIIDRTVNELNKIIAGRATQNDKTAARIALVLLAKYPVLQIKVAGYTVDDAIVNYVRENPTTLVATNDAGLMRRLKGLRLHIALVRLKQKKYLSLD
jgi:uncharacterized protein